MARGRLSSQGQRWHRAAGGCQLCSHQLSRSCLQGCSSHCHWGWKLIPAPRALWDQHCLLGMFRVQPTRLGVCVSGFYVSTWRLAGTHPGRGAKSQHPSGPLGKEQAGQSPGDSQGASTPPCLVPLCTSIHLLSTITYQHKGEVEAPASLKWQRVLLHLPIPDFCLCSQPLAQEHPTPTPQGPKHCTHTAWGSLNLPTCWIWYIKSPPFTYSITKYKRS